LKKTPAILLTFDVEEFDLPIEYGINISAENQMRVGREGLDIIENILGYHNITSTLFTTANFAIRFPPKIKELAQKHEIASHTFYHSSCKDEDLKNSLEALENIISKKVFGLRIPRMKTMDMALIKEAGYMYDSSLNPTWIPGRYNNLNKSRTLYSEKGVIELPASVSPNLRIPLFWLSFKNFPYIYFKKIALQCLKKDGYLSLYFHPWEFTDLEPYNLPGMIKRMSGDFLQNKLQKLITDLKKEGEFMAIHAFLENNIL
jgi:peptidoglycan/xylan/chitin deacetylase (PgdA/CDA1 family)